MKWHNCAKMGRYEVYKEETENEGNSQGIGWYVECNRDFGVGPIYHCPFCGEKL